MRIDAGRTYKGAALKANLEITSGRQVVIVLIVQAFLIFSESEDVIVPIYDLSPQWAYNATFILIAFSLLMSVHAACRRGRLGIRILAAALAIFSALQLFGG